MLNKNKYPSLDILGFPSPENIKDDKFRKEYESFLEQLNPCSYDNVFISNPYFFKIDANELLYESPKEWIESLDTTSKYRLAILSVICFPYDSGDKSDLDYASPISFDPVTKLLFEESFLLDFIDYSSEDLEGTEKLYIEELSKNIKVLLDSKEMRDLVKILSPKSTLEKLIESDWGQKWQLAKWSENWAVVYGITDAGFGVTYPFPWVLGFCNVKHLERNFIGLLKEGPRHFDMGFYSTFGRISGNLKLAKLALSIPDDDETPQWDLIDNLLNLDLELLNLVLDEGPDDSKLFLEYLRKIINKAEEAGFIGDDVLTELFDKIGNLPSLENIEKSLPDLIATHKKQLAIKISNRDETLSPYQDTIKSWVSIIAGPSPRSMNAGIGWNAKARHIQSYIESYTLEHRILPTGKHNLGNTETYNLKIGEINFDDVAEQAKNDPDN